VTKTADERARQRFATELDRNFSVIASAGSGKTRSITDRIVHMAQDRRALEWLPQLVVVTYTNRAADEMQQRTRQQILEAGFSLEVVEAFNRAFFGTIHSFCMKLLSAHGHYLGLPANLELITDDDELWEQFVQQQIVIGRSLSKENRRVLLRHMQVRQLMELARNYEGDLAGIEPKTPCPDTDFSDVYKAVAQGSALRTIPRAKEELKRWEKRWRETDEFVPWPPCATTAQQFVQRWRDAFRPLRDWVNACALCVAAEVQRDYRDFRLERGVVTYRDQVALAAELLRLPHIAETIRERNFRVILDEAQDTEPEQFFILLEITRPPKAIGTWTETREAPPQPGRFCMVGDFQQSIYRNADELERYRELHRLLVDIKSADELTFSVTFRLDQAHLDFVNATFREILNNVEGQVGFVELNPRPDALPGQVVRLDFANDVDLALPETTRARIEARHIAKWLNETGPKALRAESWRQVAILCPRKAWLRAMRDGLLEVGLPVEVHSESERQAENPAYAWLTALLAIMVNAHVSYEIVGVLREVFGVSDDELARFADRDQRLFQIAQPTRGRSPVADALNALTRARQSIEQQPLFSAVQEILHRTQLRERLRSLPRDEFPDALGELERLLSAAGTAEAAGASLSEFAARLRANFHTVREPNPSSADAIQLITAHKAKGSEWRAVLVPFLSRKVVIGSSAYPRLIDIGIPRIVFDRTDVTEFEEEIKRTERQEMERLLYVAVTRAKHTLVLAYDRQFFLNARGRVQDDSQLKWLRADDGNVNAEFFSALPPEAVECSDTAKRQREEVPERTGAELAALQLESGWLDSARQRASRFIHTMTPSKLAPDEEAEPSIEDEETSDEFLSGLQPARSDNAATRYGLWWHGFAQQLPWRKGVEACRDVFAAESIVSPDPARARREWSLLDQQLSQNREFRDLLGLGMMPLTEMPFFWLAGESKCLEGIVDLASFADGRAFILDWKTNRIDADEIGELRAIYRPQMAAYWRAISQLSGATVRAAIYSTAVGQLIIYEYDELETEWERLRKLSKSEFEEEILGSN
jgi:ATP-dependent helicase/nuclease subunit A